MGNPFFFQALSPIRIQFTFVNPIFTKAKLAFGDWNHVCALQ